MAKRKSNSNDTVLWIGLAVFGFICFFFISGCVQSQPKEGDGTWNGRQSMVEQITCHWSISQIKEGACWCVDGTTYRSGITLVPDKFCKKG